MKKNIRIILMHLLVGTHRELELLICNVDTSQLCLALHCSKASVEKFPIQIFRKIFRFSLLV